MSDTLTPEQMREKILAAPEPMEGEPIFDRYRDDLEAGYGVCAEALARAILVVAEERPELLDVSVERESDPSGWAAAENNKLWEAVLERWPGLSDWLGGPTGFQWGWAHNAVRYAVGAEPTGNPALVTIGEPEDPEGS